MGLQECQPEIGRFDPRNRRLIGDRGAPVDEENPRGDAFSVGHGELQATRRACLRKLNRRLEWRRHRVRAACAIVGKSPIFRPEPTGQCMNAIFPVTLADIEAAVKAIAGAVEMTPARHSRTLSEIAGAEIFLKFENLQFTASFKERGALNKLLSLGEDERKRGVIAMSAGNHAQGVAYHAGRLGIPVTIVMPEGTPFTKMKHTRDFGAHIVIEGATLSESTTRAKALAAEHGFTLIHPYDDPLVIAGQGTTALEFLEQAPELDMLVVPLGGGGLISGMAIAARGRKPDIAIYGVEAKNYPAMHNALTV